MEPKRALKFTGDVFHFAYRIISSYPSVKSDANDVFSDGKRNAQRLATWMIDVMHWNILINFVGKVEHLHYVD